MFTIMPAELASPFRSVLGARDFAGMAKAEWACHNAQCGVKAFLEVALCGGCSHRCLQIAVTNISHRLPAEWASTYFPMLGAWYCFRSANAE